MLHTCIVINSIFLNCGYLAGLIGAGLSKSCIHVIYISNVVCLSACMFVHLATDTFVCKYQCCVMGWSELSTSSMAKTRMETTCGPTGHNVVGYHSTKTARMLSSVHVVCSACSQPVDSVPAILPCWRLKLYSHNRKFTPYDAPRPVCGAGCGRPAKFIIILPGIHSFVLHYHSNINNGAGGLVSGC